MFPMTGLPDGRQHKMVTLRLKGGISNWNVKVSREWESLLRPVPELHYLPAEEYPPTYGPEHEEPAAPLLEPVEATPAAPSEGMTGG
jgi:hypothetical protein